MKLILMFVGWILFVDGKFDESKYFYAIADKLWF